jgi:hypothetical protein
MITDENKKEEKINLTIEFVDNGAILEFPDDYMKSVVEGYDKEPYHAIADNIQGAISDMVASDKYQIEIKITAL